MCAVSSESANAARNVLSFDHAIRVIGRDPATDDSMVNAGVAALSTGCFVILSPWIPAFAAIYKPVGSINDAVTYFTSVVCVTVLAGRVSKRTVIHVASY